MNTKMRCGLMLMVSLIIGAQIVSAAEHLAIVTQKGRAGAIDLQGRVVLPLEYKKIEVEQGGTDAVILVEKDGKYGMYDRTGKAIIAPTLKKVGAFSDGMLAARDQEGWTFYDRTGKALISHYDEVGPFSEGLAAVKKDGKWGYIDKQGTYILKPQYKKAQPFKEGYAAVKIQDRWMYVKKDGTALLVGKAKIVSDMSQGVGIIDGSWLMDTTGARYAKLKAYDYVGSFDEGGLARVGVRRRHRSVFDYVSIGWGWGGHWGVGFPGWSWGPFDLGWGWSDAGYHHHGWGGGISIIPGEVIHPSNLYMGAINKQGQEVIPANYRALSPFHEGRALIVDREGRFGMIDRSGKVVIPASYDELGPFEKNRAPFAYDKHWGFIDESNKIVIENRFTKVTPFVSDAAAVLDGGKAALIDLDGTNLVAPQEGYSDVGTYAQDRFPIMDKKSGKWGYMDRKGTLVIPTVYDEAGIFD